MTETLVYKRNFELLLSVVFVGQFAGPAYYLTRNCMLFSPETTMFLGGSRVRARDLVRDRARVRARVRARALVLDRVLDLDRARDLDLDLDLDLDRDLVRDRALMFSQDSASAFWEQFSANSDLLTPILDNLCDLFALTPALQWKQTLEALYIPTVPQRMYMVKRSWWLKTCKAFKSSSESEADVYAAAWQLIFDSLLYTYEDYSPEEEWFGEVLHYNEEQKEQYLSEVASIQKIFAELAEHTRGRSEAPLRIANCIRDLAYGKESNVEALKALVDSDDPELHEIFVRCYALPTPEEEILEKKEAEKKAKKNKKKK